MQNPVPSSNRHPYPNLRGLYAITDSSLLSHNKLKDAVEQAILGGAQVIQYRDKQSAPQNRKQQALDLVTLCNAHQIQCIINDDIELAKAVNAHGIHIGKDDVTIKEARNLLGNDALIGVSCYNSLELAQAAEVGGADYVAFGSFYPSITKPQATSADIMLLQEAKNQIKIPVAAIGGITPENAATIIDAGADMLAVINAVFGQPNIRQASRKFADLFN